jgi:hypothetical protein
MRATKSFLRLFLAAATLGLLLSSTGVLAQATAPVWEQLPAQADLAMQARVSSMIKVLKPEVVATVVQNHLGRALGQGLPDPTRSLDDIGLAVVVNGLSGSQGAAVAQGSLELAPLVEAARQRTPGQPAPVAWNCRGIALTAVVSPGKRTLSVGTLPDGHKLMLQHAASDNTLAAAAITAAADRSRGYSAAHPQAFPAGALLAIHVARPATLASFPQLAKVPWDSLATTQLSILPEKGQFRLNASVELTSWLRAQIVKPFIQGALNRAMTNPKLPAAAKKLLGKLTLTYEGKVFKATALASAQEIEELLLTLPGHERAAR